MYIYTLLPINKFTPSNSFNKMLVFFRTKATRILLFFIHSKQISLGIIYFQTLQYWNWMYLPTPPPGQYETQSIYKQSLTGLDFEFFSSKTGCLTMAEEPNLPYYLPFPKSISALWNVINSSRIWTCVAISISNDDNHYPTGTSLTSRGHSNHWNCN